MSRLIGRTAFRAVAGSWGVLQIVHSNRHLVGQPLANRRGKRGNEPVFIIGLAVVKPVRFRIEVPKKVERLDTDVRSLDAPLEQGPQDYRAVCVERAIGVRFGVVNEFMAERRAKTPIGRVRIGKLLRTTAVKVDPLR